MTADALTDEHRRLLRAVDRIAQMLEGTGMPRMAARVFAYVLAEDSDRYTAAELAAGMQVSPAAISGAVRYLVEQRLLIREREPGTRGDLFRIQDDDVWGTILGARIPAIGLWEDALDDAIALLGTDGRGGRRLEETRTFWSFLRTELTAALMRWRDRHDGPA